jgi:hypothetical protein
MESGRVGYQCIDTVGAGADGTGCDCIHAITDMDPQFDRGFYPLSRFGEAGSRFIVRQLFERNLLVSGETHSWLDGPLGLCRYPIIHRVYRDRPHLFGSHRQGAATGSPGEGQSAHDAAGFAPPGAAAPSADCR